MKSLKTNNFGSVRQPDSFEELLELIINCQLDECGFRTRMWRGQGNIDWLVHSSAYRRILPTNESSMVRYELGLLENATHKGYRILDGRELCDLELLARLQHHGAATRLVDTSRNALVALWFCCISQPRKTGAFIGVHTHHLGGFEGTPDTRPYKEIVNELEEYDYPFTWEPPAVTGRIAAQHSQFLYSSVKDTPYGSLVLPIEEDATWIIAITHELKSSSIEILREAFDIRQLTLFPDLDGFCQTNSYNYSQYHNERW